MSDMIDKPLDEQSRDVILEVKKLADDVRALAAPLDLAALELAGLIRRIGKRIEVPNLNALPEAVAAHIKSIDHSRGKTYVTFRSTSGFAKLAKKFEKLGL